MAGGSASGKRARDAERRGEQLTQLMHYYATGGGKDVPIERVAANCGLSIKVTRHNLAIAGRKT